MLFHQVGGLPLLLATALAWHREADATQLSLTWTEHSPNKDGFKIERKTGTSSPFAQIAMVGANLSSSTDPSLAAGATYCSQGRACNPTRGLACSDETCGAVAVDNFALTVTTVGINPRAAHARRARCACEALCRVCQPERR